MSKKSNIQDKIEAMEKKLAELKEQESYKTEWIKIPELGIEVQSKIKCITYIEAEKLCVNGLRMLTIIEASHIFDNNLIKDFVKEREWIEHYSKKTRKLGYCSSVASLGSDWDSVGGQLVVDGYGRDDGDGGFAFGVRLVRKLK